MRTIHAVLENYFSHIFCSVDKRSQLVVSPWQPAVLPRFAMAQVVGGMKFRRTDEIPSNGIDCLARLPAHDPGSASLHRSLPGDKSTLATPTVGCMNTQTFGERFCASLSCWNPWLEVMLDDQVTDRKILGHLRYTWCSNIFLQTFVKTSEFSA